MSQTESWDDIVVGGGTSGAALASRLSEDPHRRVLLLEAGPDFPDGAPAVIEDARLPVASGYNWDYTAQVKAGGFSSSAMQTVRAMAAAPVRDVVSAAAAAATGSARVGEALTQFPYFLGKVIGGSSSVNGAVALRAAPFDFAAWEALGNDAWGWSEVLPEFQALETDRDFDEGHGKTGPVPVSRPRAEELAGFHAAFLQGCREQEIPEVGDLNAAPTVGVGPIPRNVDGDRRMSSAAVYLARARGRKNLEIRGDLMVDRVLLDGRRAVGVAALNGAGSLTLRADRVALCAGAVNSPAILLRSGIGGRARCRAIGVDPLVELPGVGEGLMDHPTVVLWAAPRPGVCREFGHFHHLLARLASRAGEPPDLNLLSMANVRPDAVPMLGSLLRMPWAVGISVLLARPESKGRTYLTRRDPAARPVIELDLCSARADVQRLMHGVRQAWRVLSSGPMRQCVLRPFAWTERIVGDDGLLGSAIRGFVGSAWHAAGTTRMGRDGDGGAVVDQRCCVRGVEGLRVVDASVMPVLPSVPLGLTCLVIAERVARWMR